MVKDADQRYAKLLQRIEEEIDIDDLTVGNIKKLIGNRAYYRLGVGLKDIIFARRQREIIRRVTPKRVKSDVVVRRKWSDDEFGKIKELRDKNLTYKEIGRELGRTASSVKSKYYRMTRKK